MAIGTLSKEEFISILNTHLTPSDPVKDERRLYGRETILRDIDDALTARGRQIFIYGERGVGKTSIALTAARLHLPESQEPIYLACSSDTTFYHLIRLLAAKIVGNPLQKTEKITESAEGGASASFLGAGFNAKGSKQKSWEDGVIPEISDLNQAVDLIKWAVDCKPAEKRIIVIDEFDTIADINERGRFADLLKQLGDQAVPIQILFCGVGQSVDELFEAHNSSVRYLYTVPVERLDYDARWAIIDNSAKALGVRVPEPHRTRIAMLSDGFPHYIHLVCRELFLAMNRDQDIRDTALPEHYLEAVKRAVKGADLRYRFSYDKATQRQSPDYDLVLWAVAAHYELVRKHENIYDFYAAVLAPLRESEVLSREKFYERLRKLKSQPCGQILLSRRSGWYQFQESMVRGYVRLRAEEQGVELPFDHTPEPNPRLPTVGAPKLRPINVISRRQRWG